MVRPDPQNMYGATSFKPTNGILRSARSGSAYAKNTHASTGNYLSDARTTKKNERKT